MTIPILTLLLLLPQQAEFKEGDTVKVKTLNTGLRAKPTYFANPQQSVERGAAVVIEEIQGNWVKVSAAGKSGYVPKSSLMAAEKYDLTEAQYQIDPNNPNSARGSAGTEAAAAKGFTPQAEAKRRADDIGIDAAYKQLDKLQGLMPRKADEKLLAEMEKFRREGKLGEFNK